MPTAHHTAHGTHDATPLAPSTAGKQRSTAPPNNMTRSRRSFPCANSHQINRQVKVIDYTLHPDQMPLVVWAFENQ